MAKSKDDWNISFIYEEDLTSRNMNIANQGVLKPGVYNANLYLTTVTSSESIQYVYLTIEKGTTLIFPYAHEYEVSINTDNNEVESETEKRDLSGTGLLVKCVAANTFSVLLAQKTESADSNLATFLSTDVVYVYASNYYTNSSSDSGLLEPVINFAVKSSDGSKLVCYTCKGSVDAQYQIPYSTTKESYFISYNDEEGEGFSYLMLGAVIAVKRSTAYSDSDTNWLTTHAFTARCFKEYNNAGIWNKYNTSCDLGFSNDLTTAIFKGSNLFINGNIYKTSADYEAENLLDIDSSTLKNVGITLDKDNESFAFDDSKIKVDFLYLLAENNPVTTESLDSLLQDSSESFLGSSTLKLRKFTFDLNKFQKNSSDKLLIPELQVTGSKFSSLQNIEASNVCSFNRLSAKEAIDARTFVMHESDVITGRSLYLDISPKNIERLKKIIVNRNILPRIIDYMRYNNIIDTIDSDNESSYNLADYIVPIALCFSDVATPSSSDQPKEIGTVSGKVYGSGSSQYRLFDPNNTLCFLDLQNSTNKIDTFYECMAKNIVPAM